jgi:hypothetical protein
LEPPHQNLNIPSLLDFRIVVVLFSKPLKNVVTFGKQPKVTPSVFGVALDNADLRDCRVLTDFP